MTEAPDLRPPLVASAAATTTATAASTFHCSICLEDFIAREAATVECAHSFCFSCIHNWTNKTHSCPLCRQSVRTIAYNHAVISIPPLIIRVLVRNCLGWERMFKFKFRSTFKPLILKWYMHHCRPPSTKRRNICFFWNGSSVTATDTAKNLCMEDGAVITIKHKIKLRMEMLLPLQKIAGACDVASDIASWCGIIST